MHKVDERLLDRGPDYYHRDDYVTLLRNVRRRAYFWASAPWVDSNCVDAGHTVTAAGSDRPNILNLGAYHGKKGLRV